VSWKLSRTVLRGAVGGNADCLLDEKAAKPPKQPYAFELANGGLLGFAGLWDAWKDQAGHWLQSFAIVTTEANELMVTESGIAVYTGQLTFTSVNDDGISYSFQGCSPL